MNQASKLSLVTKKGIGMWTKAMVSAFLAMVGVGSSGCMLDSNSDEPGDGGGGSGGGGGGGGEQPKPYSN